MIGNLLASLSILMLVGGCDLLGLKSQTVLMSRRHVRSSLQNAQEIDRETATSIATSAFGRANGHIEQFNVFACEEGTFWRMIFDRRDVIPGKKDPEYIIAKDGRIIDIEMVSHNLPKTNQRQKVTLSQPIGISKETAIEISERDAIAVYKSLKEYTVVVCELSRSWRVIYSLKKSLHGGGPDYVIDKQ